MAEKKNFYPHLVVKNNEHPNKLYAFPFVGIIIKLIMLIPVFFMCIFLTFAYLFFWISTPFVILFTGKYWKAAYEFNIGYLTFYTKIILFLLGITDKYPGFNLKDNGIFELHLEKPSAPSRWMSFPILGFLARLILLIPYIIFESVLSYGNRVAMFISWFAVLLKGKFPESLYEFERDSLRVSLASTAYITYLSDTYPSFSISMKHKNIKILLIIAGALLFLGNAANGSSAQPRSHDQRYDMQEYNNSIEQNYVKPRSGS